MLSIILNSLVHQSLYDHHQTMLIVFFQLLNLRIFNCCQIQEKWIKIKLDTTNIYATLDRNTVVINNCSLYFKIIPYNVVTTNYRIHFFNLWSFNYITNINLYAPKKYYLQLLLWVSTPLSTNKMILGIATTISTFI